MKNLEQLKKDYEKLGETIKALENKPIYPIYCKDTRSSLVVKFTGLTEGEVVVNNMRHVGYKSTCWDRHTDTDCWQQLEVSENCFFDGQAVYAWDDHCTHCRILSFWDAKNNRLFSYKGNRDGIAFHKYAPFEGNYTDFMLEMFNTLER